MGREVITKKDIQAAALTARLPAGAGAPPATPDDYKDRLLKYIPGDIVAIYVALKNGVGLMQEPTPIPVHTLYWAVFWIVLVLSVPWQLKVAKIRKWKQIAITTGAFAVWSTSLGHPFSAEMLGNWYQPALGALVLTLYTFIVAMFEVD